MATRSFIGKKEEDGSVKYIYCHSDGYLSHNGFILSTHYTDPQKVDKLIELGDISFLHKHVEPQSELAPCRYNWRITEPVRHSFDTPHEDVTVAYRRDRGDENTGPHKAGNVDDFSKLDEIRYLFDDGVWKVYSRNPKLEPVENELDGGSFYPVLEVIEARGISV